MSDTLEGVTLAPDADPIGVLRTMAKFLPGTERGIAEIKDGDARLGYVALVGEPEKVALPVFDAHTRRAEVVDLAAWLKARGYEAAACRWTSTAAMTGIRHPEINWLLTTGPAVVPKLPPATTAAGGPLTSAQGAAALQQRDATRYRLPYARR